MFAIFHPFPSDSRQERHRRKERRDLGERGKSLKKGDETHGDRNTLMMSSEPLNTLPVVSASAHVWSNTSLQQTGAPSMSCGKF